MRSTTSSLVLAISAAILAAAYSAEYIGGLRPCTLCLYERVPWFVAGALSLGIVVLQFTGPMQRLLLLIGGLALLAGAGISVYHVGVEEHWWAGPTGCSAPAELPQSLAELKSQLRAAAEPRCDEIPWQLWGISMAGYNGIASFCTAALALIGRR